MDACLQQQYPPFFQLKQERPTLRANARQREVVFKRVKAAPQPARSPASLHHEALGKAITRRTLDVRAILARRFSQCFRGFSQPKLPLKTGIVVDAIIACPDIKPHAVALAIADYCRGASYHAAMVEGAARVDLDGNAAGLVSRRAAERARRILKKLEAHP